MKRRNLLASLAAAALVAPVQAQGDFPNKRITLVVSAATGGGLDGVARLLSKRMQDAWGQPVIVENQGGADGLIATQRVGTAPPDGHTMLLQIPSLLLLKHNVRDGSDPAAALLPVAELGRTPSAVAVNAKLGVNSLKDLVAHCNASARPCTWGSGQQLSFLYGKRLFALSGMKEPVNVPYKGTGPVINDLLGGHIEIGITSIAAPLQHHQKGTLKILAVNAERRAPQVPDVPTFREVGINVPARGSWYGLFVPRGTPPEVIGKIERLVTSMAGDAQAQEVVRGLGAEPVFGSTRDFAAGIREEESFLEQLVKQYPLK